MEGTKLILFLIFYGVIIFLLIKLLIKACKAQSQVNKRRRQDKASGIKRFSGLVHVSGLKAVEGTACEVMIDPKNVAITCGVKQYTLPLSRISYVDFKFDVNESKYLKSSFVKGAAGAAMFGVSGAVIGSAPKTKTDRQTKGYAIILYKDTRGEEDTIILRDMSPNSYICSKLVMALNACIKPQIEKVEL